MPTVPPLSGGLSYNQHVYRARYRVLPSPCADTTQLNLMSYSQSWLQVPEAVLKETSRFSQLHRPVPRGLLQLLGLLPSPGPPAKAPLVAGGLWQQDPLKFTDPWCPWPRPARTRPTGGLCPSLCPASRWLQLGPAGGAAGKPPSHGLLLWSPPSLPLISCHHNLY